MATVLAPGAELLNAARLVQGFGGSSGLVLGRAMARARVAGWSERVSPTNQSMCAPTMPPPVSAASTQPSWTKPPHGAAPGTATPSSSATHSLVP